MAELADKVGPVGLGAQPVAILGLAVLFAAIVGWGMFNAGRMDREERRANRAEAQILERRAAQLARVADELERRAAELARLFPPGAHRVPEPDLLHEEMTTDLGPYRPLRGAPWD